MFFEINKIFLKDDIFDSYEVFNKEDSLKANKKLLTDISKINLFIGANNSGKSRFLRYLFFLARIPVFHKIQPSTDLGENEITELIEGFETDIRELSLKYNLKNSNEFKRLFNSLKKIKNEPDYNIKKQFFQSAIESLRDNILPSLGEFLKKQNITNDKQGIVIAKIHSLFNIFSKICSNTNKEIDFVCDIIMSEKSPAYKIIKIYIPVLRGLRILDTDTDEMKDFYNIRTIFDYFLREELAGKSWKLSDNIFTGLTLYQTIMEHLLGNLVQRQLIAEYQTFLQEYFFDGKEIVLIPSLKPKVLNIKIGSEKEQPIHNLGDGLQSLIILTFPLFQYHNEHVLLFIEEPELFLHPGMQRILLEVYNEERFNHVQFFIATHSNHLLDISMDIDDISIFTVRKNKIEIKDTTEYLPSFTIENCSNRDRKILELIGVRNASVFLSNCTIWVEGITDRLYVRHYLTIYQKYMDEKNPAKNRPFREDTHFSFLEYGGNNIEHFSFLDEANGIQPDFLCGKLFLIVDKDRGKEERHEKLKKMLGDNFKKLDRIEIENLISEKVLKEIMKEYEKDSQKKIDAIKYADYADIGVGDYINNLFNNKKYQADSGTLKTYWKKQFCKKTIEYTKAIDDLSKDAIELCERLYIFIKSQNQT